MFPWLQGGALWVNCFLVCQLPRSGLVALGSYVGFAVVHYTCYGASHSVGNCSGWSLLLSSAAAAKLSTTASQCSPFATMDSEGLAGVIVGEGYDDPLLGDAGIHGDGGEAGRQSPEEMRSEPSASGVGIARNGSGRMVPPLRRRQSEGFR